jgi:hypothetical protein
MYIVAYWEIVHSIYLASIGVILPNHGSSKYTFMYCDVLRWTGILLLAAFLRPTITCRQILNDAWLHHLPLACRKPLLRSEPLQESALSIPDATADF